MTRLAPLLAVSAALLLAACEDSAAPETTAQGGEVTGDVLGGTISDDMIAMEQLQSQSPPAKIVPQEGGPAASAAPEEPTNQAPPEGNPDPGASAGAPVVPAPAEPAPEQ